MKILYCLFASLLFVSAYVQAINFPIKVPENLKEEFNKKSPVDFDKSVELGKTLISIVDNKIGPADEFFMGRESAARILGAYNVVNPDNKAYQYVQDVGTTMALASHKPYVYRNYNFILLDSDEINAFASPGGLIFVTTGMLKFLKNEDELSTILGHEIAHIELQHGINSVGKEKVIKLFNMIFDIFAEKRVDNTFQSKLINSLMDEVIGTLTNNIRQGYNIDMEGQADDRGLEIALEAGYNPAVFTNILSRFLSTKNSYGGANYPKDRGLRANSKLAAMGLSTENVTSKKLSVREKRYKEILTSLYN
jgi:predicted Zn-dependent protease